MSGTKEDKLYWVLASVEGSYGGGSWDHGSLHGAIHWAIMLGFDVKVLDSEKREILNSDMVISMLSPAMKRKMKNIADISPTIGDFEPYPLYHEGSEVGTMLVREIDRPLSVNRKELMFKGRGKTFLLSSFAIAGGGAVLLSVFFTLFLSKPLKKMKGAVQAMANRDFSVRMPVMSRDEIGSLSASFNFMAEALEREEALRKHLTSNIAHELRTPLSVMKANVEAMLDGVIEDNVRGLKNVQAELEKLIRLVQGIEDITKAEASFFTQKEYVTVSLRDFIAGIGEKMRPLASAKGLEIQIKDAGDVSVHTDADKLERILQNILSNAIKNTREGGIVIDYGTKNEMFFVGVKDTGSGIGKEELELIFKRFYHGPESGGLGLGLAIVKRFVEEHKGTISFENNPSGGAAFTIHFPISQAITVNNNEHSSY